ncbi:glucans biosynthesis glucosyltransferase MdoH [Pseudoxanthomonas winnipegensis]|uniref:glucans biosynthesis glucosyltransferase MdoH n=1 Tax=Pseudoxanthomonas winnipegensis TaxID=2480810 RepID=UPI00103B3686|nr:glucans biosynthesis glucosyltransferase MdoH [Pseudoxanthomonas winnipegensis]TBV75876.1 glucans biosynthesis glucosyltransferase MdoH [Pseudoxanthomonas winnipegensis]
MKIAEPIRVPYPEHVIDEQAFAYELLPPPAPLEMPQQSLRTGKLRSPPMPSSPPNMALRRLYIFGGTLAITLVGLYQMFRVMATDGINLLEGLFLTLFALLFAWVSLSFCSALAGFLLIVTRRRRRLGLRPEDPLPTPTVRTALLMPTYNEEPQRLMAGLQAIYESVRETGHIDRFDFFILSDTTRGPIRMDEVEEFHRLRERLGGAPNLYYRHRADNAERKAGNIAEWVRRFGAAYPQMLILDADSLMTGDTIVRLAWGMETHPDVGLIQSLPLIVNGSTLFARMQQFAGRVYGPVIAHGVAWWHGTESNYWGHNAVIRTQAFADHAGLPKLGGVRPFKGHVLSHDFVEAALIRRGGWACHMTPALGGSFEEGPPSLTDLLVRDRRWCQGNLQHVGILPTRGLHWISRTHFMIGIGHYLTAPMWAMMMLIGIAIPLEQAGTLLSLSDLAHFSPVSYWRSLDPDRILYVFEATMFALFAPKVMGYLAVLADRKVRRGCGGWFRMIVSIVIESVLAALMAPIVMYVQSRGVAEVLAGKDSGWDAQRRDDGSMPWGLLVRRYGGLSVFGLLMGAAAYFVSPSLALWMSPVIAGLVLSIPIVALTSARGPGQALRRLKLLSIPEETRPPAILVRAGRLRQRIEAEAEAAAEAN